MLVRDAGSPELALVAWAASGIEEAMQNVCKHNSFCFVFFAFASLSLQEVTGTLEKHKT